MKGRLLLLAAFLLWPGCSSQDVRGEENWNWPQSSESTEVHPCVIPRTELESQKIEVKNGTDENIFVERGLSIELTCRTGYVLAENSSQPAFVMHCDGTPPMIPKCKEITCNSPKISNGSFRPQRTVYHDGDLIRIRCDSGFTFEPVNGDQVVECTKNGWSPSPKCLNIEGKCGRPPPVENGDVVDTPKLFYLHSESVTYQCQHFYTMQGPRRVTCQNGLWSQTPTCRVPCTAREEDMTERNIRLRWPTGDTLYVPDGNVVEFVCLRGYRPHPTSGPFRIYCVEGKFDYPYCIRSN